MHHEEDAVPRGARQPGRYFLGVKDSIGLVLETLRRAYGIENVLEYRFDEGSLSDPESPLGDPEIGILRYQLDKASFVNSCEHIVLEFLGMEDLDLFVTALTRLLDSQIESLYVFTTGAEIVQQMFEMGTESERQAVDRLKQEGRLIIRDEFNLPASYFARRD